MHIRMAVTTDQLNTSYPTNAQYLSGAEMIAQFLKDEGVDFIFGYPGGATLHIYDALFREGSVRHILVRHEQAATHAADGYARATGNPGTVLVTSGPGATNAVTGIATAYMDSIPMVVLCGQVASHLIGKDAFQETDVIGVTRPIVKHSFSIRHPRDIPKVLKQAYYLAASGRPGPVVVDIPKDMTQPNERYEYVYPAQVNMRSYAPPERGHSGQIRKAVEMLLGASRPIFFIGGGVITGNACVQLIELVQHLGYPITTSLMGIGAYPQSDPLSLGWVGMHGSYESNMAMHHCDLIIAIGVRFDDRATNDPSKFCPEARIVHIDIDPSSIFKTVRVDIPIVGSADRVIDEIIEQVLERPASNAEAITQWWAKIEGWRAERCGKLYEPAQQGEPLKPQQVIEALCRVSGGEAFVTTDVGQHQMFAAQYYKFNRPRRFITSGGLGTMGFGFPAAIGIKLRYPQEHVICVTSEGSFQMMMQELATCRQYALGVKVIHLNNGCLGMVRQWQDLNYDARHAHSYMESLPDFQQLIGAYGFLSIKVERLEDLEPALTRALSTSDELVFVDIRVDPREHVYPMHLAQGSMADMQLSKSM